MATGESKNGQGEKLPTLVAFDLDDTIWSPEMWLCSGAPFSKCSDGEGHVKVLCKDGEQMTYLGDSEAILWALHDEASSISSIRVAYISRTSYPEWAYELLGIMPVRDVANGRGETTTMSVVGEEDIHQIYPKNKTVHFARVHELTGIPYNEMLFFDNQMDNIESVSPLGVTSIYTPRGMTWKHWEEGLAKFRNQESS